MERSDGNRHVGSNLKTAGDGEAEIDEDDGDPPTDVGALLLEEAQIYMLLLWPCLG